MEWLRRLFGLIRNENGERTKLQKVAQIEALGFELNDQSGWLDGQFAERRYFLERNGEIVAGPFAATAEVLQAARRLVGSEPKPRN